MPNPVRRLPLASSLIATESYVEHLLKEPSNSRLELGRRESRRGKIPVDINARRVPLRGVDVHHLRSRHRSLEDLDRHSQRRQGRNAILDLDPLSVHVLLHRELEQRITDGLHLLIPSRPVGLPVLFRVQISPDCFDRASNWLPSSLMSTMPPKGPHRYLNASGSPRP